MTEEEKKLRELLTKESVDAYRVHIIEECARVAEESEYGYADEVTVAVAAIRALKEKQ